MQDIPVEHTISTLPPAMLRCRATCPIGLLCITQQLVLLGCYFCHVYTAVTAEAAEKVIAERKLKTERMPTIDKGVGGIVWAPSEPPDTFHKLTFQNWEHWKNNRIECITLSVLRETPGGCNLLNRSVTGITIVKSMSMLDVCNDCSRKINHEFTKPPRYRSLHPKDKREEDVVFIKHKYGIGVSIFSNTTGWDEGVVYGKRTP